MKKQPEYTYERDASIWVIVRWAKNSGKGYSGKTVETHTSMEDARRRVFELNGWNYKPKK